uniref:Uncharacterized protein n=2 Tax=Rhizophora mucronata TaxID=61149 RepID=A0A2P2KIX1_RHIMU
MLHINPTPVRDLVNGLQASEDELLGLTSQVENQALHQAPQQYLCCRLVLCTNPKQVVEHLPANQ